MQILKLLIVKYQNHANMKVFSMLHCYIVAFKHIHCG